LKNAKYYFIEDKKKDLAQVAFDLIDRFRVGSVKTQHQRQT